jgi:hypothetical protein
VPEPSPRATGRRGLGAVQVASACVVVDWGDGTAPLQTDAEKLRQGDRWSTRLADIFLTAQFGLALLIASVVYFWLPRWSARLRHAGL